MQWLIALLYLALTASINDQAILYMLSIDHLVLAALDNVELRWVIHNRS